MRAVIERLADAGAFLDVSTCSVPYLVVSFVRVGGMAVGIVANQPQRLVPPLSSGGGRLAP